MLLLLLFFSGYQLHVGHSQGLRPFISTYWTVQNADCRPLFSVLESNGTIVVSPSFAWSKQWSAAVCSLHFVRTVLATKLSGSNFGPQWLSPFHCHGRCESIVFSCSFQTGTLQLFCLFSAKKGSQMKLWKRWSKQQFNALWFNLSSVPVVSGRLSLPLWTHEQFQHWTTPTNSAVWPVPYACAQPYHPCIGASKHGTAIGHMNQQSRVGSRRASGLKWVLPETCSEEYMTKKAVKMRDLTHVPYSLRSSSS